MEKRIPFIAAIISEFIVFAAAALFFRDYLAPAVAVLAVATIVLRFEAWSLIGGFLTGVAIQLYLQGKMEELRVVGLVLLAGTILQVVSAFAAKLVSGIQSPSPSTRQTAVFAMIGMTLSIGLQLALCPPVPPDPALSRVEQIISQVGQCEAKFAAGSYAEVRFDELGRLELINVLVITCTRLFLIFPTTWAAVFAALRQVNFNILAPRQLLSQTIRAYGGLVIGGIILGGLLGTPIALVALASESLSSSGPLSETWLALSMGIGLFSLSIGAGWGAGWGMRRP